jgi:hypothetical protein
MLYITLYSSQTSYVVANYARIVSKVAFQVVNFIVLLLSGKNVTGTGFGSEVGRVSGIGFYLAAQAINNMF